MPCASSCWRVATVEAKSVAAPARIVRDRSETAPIDGFVHLCPPAKRQSVENLTSGCLNDSPSEVTFGWSNGNVLLLTQPQGLRRQERIKTERYAGVSRATDRWTSVCDLRIGYEARGMTRQVASALGPDLRTDAMKWQKVRKNCARSKKRRAIMKVRLRSRKQTEREKGTPFCADPMVGRIRMPARAPGDIGCRIFRDAKTETPGAKFPPGTTRR